MANTEDYLDGLLDSVNHVRKDVKAAEAQAEAVRMERADRRNKIAPSDDFMEANGLDGYEPEPTEHKNLRQAFSEDEFLRSFEEELNDGYSDTDEDALIRDFERELYESELEDRPSPAEGGGTFLENVDQAVHQAKEQIESGKAPEADGEGELPPLEGFGEDELDMDLLTGGFDDADKTEIRYDSPKKETQARAQSAPPLTEEEAQKQKEDEEVAGIIEDLQDELETLNEPAEQTPSAEGTENEPDLFEGVRSIMSEGGEAQETEGAAGGEDAPEPMLSEDDENVDLMDLLSGDEELDQIGSLLEADDSNVELEETAQEYEAQAEMAAETGDELPAGPEEGGEPEEEDESQALKGLFAKIKSLFSRGSKKKEVLDLSAPEKEDLNKENMEILQEMDADGRDAKKDRKAGKEKKEKPPKEKKEKKVKEKRPPKEKKQKKPKEPDNSPKIPGKVILVFLALAASLVALVTIGQKIVGDDMALRAAKKDYENGRYLDAYDGLIGLELDEADQELMQKARLLGDLEKRSGEYTVFMKLEDYDLALDSLLIGVSRYYAFKDEAAELAIADAYDAMGAQLEQQLKDQFGVSAEEAVEISKMNRENYSLRISEIVSAMQQ